MSSSQRTLVHFSSEYTLSLLNALYDQLKTSEFCDITLDVAGQKFSAHRNILAAASPYFHAMFTGGLSESKQTEICLHGTSPEIFQVLLKFMYTGDIDITSNSCEDMLAAADLFGIPGILEACCLFLQQHLHPANCLGIYQLADAHCCEDLKLAAEEYVNNHFLDVIKEDEFLELPKDVLVHFLTSEHVHIDNEVQMLDAAIHWVKHDIIKRRILIFQLLAVIRFPLIPKAALEKSLAECGDLSLEIAIRKTAQDFSDMTGKSLIGCSISSQQFQFCVRKGARRKVMVIGGQRRDMGGKWNEAETLASVEIFDISRMIRFVAPSMKYGRSCHACAVLNGLVYVIGGENDSLIFDSVEYYDPSTNSWNFAPNMIEPRCGHGAAVVDGCLYALGGWVGSKNGHSIEMLDSEANKWMIVDKMKTPRYHMGIVAHEGLIYVLGGIGEMGREVRVAESYNPVTKEWCRLSDMLTPRAHPGVCVSDDMIYVVGGMKEDEGPLKSVEKYDIFQDKWTVLTMLPTPRAGAGVVYLSGLLYVFGGKTCDGGLYSDMYTINNVDCYDQSTDCWLRLEPMSTARSEGTVVVL